MGLPGRAKHATEGGLPRFVGSFAGGVEPVQTTPEIGGVEPSRVKDAMLMELPKVALSRTE